MRDRGDIGDRANLEADCPEGANGGLAARAGALDEDVDALHAVFHRTTTGGLGCHLCGVRRGLAGPLKPTVPADAQAMTAPLGSVIEMTVLLKVLLMWACPATTFFFSLRRTFWRRRRGLQLP